MITAIFIIAITLIIVVYDVWALVTKRRTITSWLMQWYGIGKEDKGLPVVPYAIACIFLGHVPRWIDFSFINEYICLVIFILFSICVIIFTAINEYQLHNDPDDVSKFYFFMKDKWYLSMLVGAVIGCLWYL